MHYSIPLITTFGDKAKARIFQGKFVNTLPRHVQALAYRKWLMIDAAESIYSLHAPPGNRLEALRGHLAGKHSIRINDQWRIVFLWSDQGPEEVEIVDYH